VLGIGEFQVGSPWLNVVDLARLLKPDPDPVQVEAAGGEFLAGDAIQIKFPAGDRGQDLGVGDLDKPDLIDDEIFAGVGHGVLLGVG
jgi:hypothetical protein